MVLAGFRVGTQGRPATGYESTCLQSLGAITEPVRESLKYLNQKKREGERERNERKDGGNKETEARQRREKERSTIVICSSSN